MPPALLSRPGHDTHADPPRGTGWLPVAEKHSTSDGQGMTVHLSAAGLNLIAPIFNLIAPLLEAQRKLETFRGAAGWGVVELSTVFRPASTVRGNT
ncbi:uncharacterized protein BP5553_01904 [Venustampulla echinocandica]|uniref:Uncharacterized protein n=1 Tax=Venustampulla echinocandica TaxID=2656787 RepID=A0A370U2E2_9HELO|nr:uncharacterized protein BP5553_01904 [Venustampulla echinocandica]RDL41925.1 hypothetical protein BP5553_01904 [Venustampulla echinocandica]